MATSTLVKGARSTRSTVALKLLMAASGLVFIGYLVLHMYGNLKVFSGEQAFNEYAHHLREFGAPMLPYEGLLWIVRTALIVALVAHLYAAAALTARATKARSTRYVMKRNVASSLSSRTMRWGGLALLLFVIWHLVHFTVPKVNPAGGDTNNPYRLLVDSFSPDVWWMAVIYLLALAALALHLHHGTWSALQTLGLTSNARARARAKFAGVVLAVAIAGGFALVPLSVLLGIVS